MSVGATGTNFTQPLRVFRALGLATETGELTERGKRLALGGESRKSAIREAVVDAYPSLVQRLNSGEEFTTAQLAQAMGDLSDGTLGKSARVQAARFFRFLVGESEEPHWCQMLNTQRRSPTTAERRQSGVARKAAKGMAVPGPSAPMPSLSSEAQSQMIVMRLTYGTARLDLPGRLAAQDITRLKQQINVFQVEDEEPKKDDQL